MGEHSESALQYHWRRGIPTKGKRRKRGRVMTCQYCGQRNLRWLNVKGGGWRLATKDGDFHYCEEYAKENAASKDDVSKTASATPQNAERTQKEISQEDEQCQQS